jgi:hypothetical protein
MLDLKNNISFTIPFRPRPGQALLFVDLSTALNPIEILDILIQLGYEPVLKYRQLPTGKQELCALLKFEQYETSYPTEEYLTEEWGNLCETSGINPDFIRCQRGHFKQPVAAA